MFNEWGSEVSEGLQLFHSANKKRPKIDKNEGQR